MLTRRGRGKEQAKDRHNQTIIGIETSAQGNFEADLLGRS